LTNSSWNEAQRNDGIARLSPSFRCAPFRLLFHSDARSQIADVDFAAESSNLARQQVLFQASVSVLQQSGQTRQMLLQLLQ